MNRIHHARRIAGILASLAATAVAFTIGGSATAFARIDPPMGGPAGTVQTPSPVPTVTVVTGGMPGWQITLIATAAAIAAAALAVALYRAYSAGRHLTAPEA